ncbi:MAG TPA: hypothetical protein VFQ45_09085 [Longimicrobium sp.]|nr:hypothetical protein [Longimicrobium sp.]
MTHAPLTALPRPALAVVLQAVPDGVPDWVSILATVSLAVIAIALIAVGIAITVAALKLIRLLRALRADLAPAVKHLTAVSANAEQITGRLKENVGELSATVSDANRRLREAGAAAEQRLGDLNALAKVVQGEAEHVFVSAAAAARGVRSGARALRGRRRRRAETDFEEELEELLEDETGADDEPAPRRVTRAGRPLRDA